MFVRKHVLCVQLYIQYIFLFLMKYCHSESYLQRSSVWALVFTKNIFVSNPVSWHMRCLIQSKAKCWSFVQLLIIKFLTQDKSKRFSACQHAAAAILNVGFKRRHQMDKLRLGNQILRMFGTFCLVQRNSISNFKDFGEFRLIFCFICWLFGQHQLTFDIRILWVRIQTEGEHTYLARRSTMITKVVPLGWGLSIAHRLGWPLRLPQTWVTRARNFW